MQLDLPSVQQDVQDEDKTQNRPAMRLSPCIHFIETTPSVLRDIPWIQLREHKVDIKCMYTVVEVAESDFMYTVAVLTYEPVCYNYHVKGAIVNSFAWVCGKLPLSIH